MEYIETRDLALRSPLVCSLSRNDDNDTTSPPPQPPLSFLYRMYVACDVLQLSAETRFTSLVLLHRYAAAVIVNQSSHRATNNNVGDDDNSYGVAAENTPPSLTANDWPWVGGACIFLACKTEEEPRRLRDIINMIYMVLSNKSNENGAGDDATSVNPQPQSQSKQPTLLHMTSTPPMLDDQYWESKQRVIDTEQAVLRWLGFDCHVSHPHRAVAIVLEQQQQQLGPTANDDDDKVLLLQRAFRYLNNALFYRKALTFSVMELAVAAIQLATEEEGCPSLGALSTLQATEYNVSDDALQKCRNCLLHIKALMEKVHSRRD